MIKRPIRRLMFHKERRNGRDQVQIFKGIPNIQCFSMVRRRKQDFSNYVSDILQNSMLTGIPQIASAGNWPKKIVRTLVFVMCLAGFAYQSLTFMWMYWEYEVIVDVRVSNPTHVERPSFTICIENGFKSIEFCEDPESEALRKEHRILCEELEEDEYAPDMCICNPRLCDIDGKTLKNLTFLYDYDRVWKLPRSDIKKWLLEPKDVLSQCYDIKMREGTAWNICRDKYTVERVSQFNNYYPEFCFTRNSLIGRPNYTIEKVFTDAEIRLRLEQNDDLVSSDVTRNEIHIAIHNPQSVVNPYTNGYSVKAGYRYFFSMKKVYKKLLPHPYATNCKDYKTEWLARGGQGPWNLRECIMECQLNISLKTYGCVTKNIYMPTNELRCKVDYEERDQNFSLYKDAIDCSKENCRPACEEEYYITSLTTEEDTLINCYRDNYKKRPESSLVFIRLDGMETTSYIYSPKFQDIETFSYLGGYVGMWLGISLVAVFDFVETLIVMMKYPMRRMMHYKERRKRVDQIRSIQRNF